ncbi:hypothetical protein [Streptomyces sp. NPDC094466]|uniref:hypothetical protein n=1 Tax=Streptomyces sp. NPDC094466 TaxID=3366065 RepID=UPI00380AC164
MTTPHDDPPSVRQLAEDLRYATKGPLWNYFKRPDHDTRVGLIWVVSWLLPEQWESDPNYALQRVVRRAFKLLPESFPDGSSLNWSQIGEYLCGFRHGDVKRELGIEKPGYNDYYSFLRQTAGLPNVEPRTFRKNVTGEFRRHLAVALLQLTPDDFMDYREHFAKNDLTSPPTKPEPDSNPQSLPPTIEGSKPSADTQQQAPVLEAPYSEPQKKSFRLRALLRRRSTLSLLFAGVLVISGATTYITWPDSSPKENNLSPLHIDGVTPLTRVDPQEYLYVTPSKVDISDMQVFNREVASKPNYFDGWLMRNRAVVANIGYSNVTLRNTSKGNVQIIGVNVAKQCSAPLDGTIVYGPVGHAEASGIEWSIDLDQSEPVVMSNVSFAGDGGTPEGKSYFAKKNIAFTSGETVTIAVSARSLKQYCRFRFELILATESGQKTKIVDNNGKPFEVSGVVSQYQEAYVRDASSLQWNTVDPRSVFR